MKYTIEWSEVKTTSTGKEYKKITAKDEQGQSVDASVWSDASMYAQVAPGATIEAEIRKSSDGKYTNLVDSNIATQGAPRVAGMMAAKEKSIANAQDRKERSIHAAQDRNMWMWGKYGACELVAHHPSYKFLSEDKILALIEELATEIYNMEPTKPF